MRRSASKCGLQKGPKNHEVKNLNYVLSKAHSKPFNLAKATP